MSARGRDEEAGVKLEVESSGSWGRSWATDLNAKDG